jgi:hypothetical protein
VVPGGIVHLKIPWDLLGLLTGAAVVTVLLVTLIGLLFLRASVRPTELRTT